MRHVSFQVNGYGGGGTAKDVHEKVNEEPADLEEWEPSSSIIERNESNGRRSIDVYEQDDESLEEESVGGDQYSYEEYPDDYMGPKFVEEPEDSGPITYSRKIARYLSQYKWYYPERDNPDVCLDEAWSYFERVTLPRYFCDDIAKRQSGLERAARGEKQRNTRLYSPISTPLDELADFGIGVGIYFATLRALIVLLILGGIINWPSINYYSSAEYDAELSMNDTSWYDHVTLAGSAVCTSQSYVVCLNCRKHSYGKGGISSSRLEKIELMKIPVDITIPWIDETINETVTFTNGTIGVENTTTSNYDLTNGTITWTNETISLTNDVPIEIPLALKNSCNHYSQVMGTVSIADMVFILLAVIVLGKYISKVETRFDENEQTSTDYSIRIKNPPKTVYDPDEYKILFEGLTGTHVTAVSIALNNYDLLTKLAERRLAMRKLRMMQLVEEKKSLGNDRTVRRKSLAVDYSSVMSRDSVLKTRCGRTAITESFLQRQILKLEKQIRVLFGKKYYASQVFVTFETEKGQRMALKGITDAQFELRLGRRLRDGSENRNVIEAVTFQGEVLEADEPPEPSAVLWRQIGVSQKTRLVQYSLTTFLTTLAVLVVAIVVMNLEDNKDEYWVGLPAVFVSVMNTVVPAFCKIISSYESHDADGDYQVSLYSKITFVRWFNTAILFTVITPFDKTIDSQEGLLKNVFAVFLAEMVTAPALKMLDITSHFKKHFLAPRCKTQTEMNLHFRGTFYFLAERYTDMTKIFFLTCWYAVIFPVGYFWGAVSLGVYYWTDKFCVMRTWAAASALGTQLSKLSRQFFAINVLALAVLSSYWWSGFPYDNVCSCGDLDNQDREECDVEYFSSQLIRSNSTWENVTINLECSDGDNVENLICLPNQVWSNVTVNTQENLAHLDLDPSELRSNVNSTVNITDLYFYCNQDLLRQYSFPAIPQFWSGQMWMTDDQYYLSTAFGWTSVAFLIGLLWLMFGDYIMEKFFAQFKNTYDPFATKDQYIDFSCVPEIFGYVPQYVHKQFQYPLLACDTDSIDTNLIPWECDSSGFDYWNLIYDVDGWQGQTRTRSHKTPTTDTIPNATPVFSVIKHYPPAWYNREDEEAEGA